MHQESRKRPHADDDDNSVNKRRVLTSANGSPLSNGANLEQDEPTLDNLELFRKEAIFRRMLYYSRENERSHARIAELTRRKNTCEAGYAAIVACWTQLVEAIHLLVKQEDLPQVDIDAEELFDLAKHLPGGSSEELTLALGDKASATRTLVSSFVRLGEKSSSRSFDNNAYLDCQKAATACAALQSQVSLLRSQLKDCENQRDRYAAELVVAENRYERARSRTIQAMEARKASAQTDVKKEETEELQQRPSSPTHSPTPTPVNGVHDMFEVEVLREQLQHREAKIVELEREIAVLRDQNMMLEAELRSKTEQNGQNNDAYKLALQKVEYDLAERCKQTQVLEEDVRRLTTAMEKHDNELLAAASKQLQELQTMLQKRDADNARLREQRDQQNAELVERRHKDAIKYSSLEQLKQLAENRAASERIIQLELEVNQCKAHLAAHTGDKQLLLSFLHGDEGNKQRWEILQEQLRQAEIRIASLEQTISDYGEDTEKYARAHVELSQTQLELTEQLEKYRALLGPSASPEVADLTRLLKEKEEELERLKLSDAQRGEVEKSLYAELDKLSSAWEALDRQVKSKVFDLIAMEERLSKSAMDKAKAENKFYAAMRDKEALEIEKKSFMRNLEKQGKAVEKLVDTEASLLSHVNLLEKETATQKKIIDTLKENIRQSERSQAEMMGEVGLERSKGDEMLHACQRREKILEAKRTELRAIEDGLIRARKEAERQSSRMREATTLSASSSKEGSDSENLKAILKCSTCRINFRSTVITKCMHTFCKECVEKRILTRQRKCPACNLAFAQSDVQQFWFQ